MLNNYLIMVNMFCIMKYNCNISRLLYYKIHPRMQGIFMDLMVSMIYILLRILLSVFLLQLYLQRLCSHLNARYLIIYNYFWLYIFCNMMGILILIHLRLYKIHLKLLYINLKKYMNHNQIRRSNKLCHLKIDQFHKNCIKMGQFHHMFYNLHYIKIYKYFKLCLMRGLVHIKYIQISLQQNMQYNEVQSV